MDQTLEKIQSEFSKLIAHATETDRTVLKLVMKNSYLSKRIAQYEKEMKTKTIEIAELKSMLSTEKNSAIQKSVVEKMEKENQELYKKVESLTTQLKEANDRVLKLASELLSEELQNFELNEGKIRLEEEIDEAKDRAMELANELRSEELENFVLNEAKTNLEQQLKEEYNRHNKMMDDYQQIVEEEIAKLKLEKAELQKIVEDQKQIITRSKAKHAKATVHVKNLKSVNNLLTAENGELKNIVSMKDEMIQKLSDRIAELENIQIQNNGDDVDHGFDDEEQSSEDEGILYDAESPDEDGNLAVPITSAWASIPVSQEEIAEELASMKNVSQRKPGRRAKSKRPDIIKKRIQMRKYRALLNF